MQSMFSLSAQLKQWEVRALKFTWTAGGVRHSFLTLQWRWSPCYGGLAEDVDLVSKPNVPLPVWAHFGALCRKGKSVLHILCQAGLLRGRQWLSEPLVYIEHFAKFWWNCMAVLFTQKGIRPPLLWGAARHERSKHCNLFYSCWINYQHAFEIFAIFWPCLSFEIAAK